MNQEKILVYGGAFNPPTVAHQAVMAACLEMTGFDQVWVMPSGDRLDKHMEVGDEERLAMLGLIKQSVFKDSERLVISDFELNADRPTQTYQTVDALKAKYSQYEWWFCFGADAYYGMQDWDEGERLKAELNMVIIGRNNLPLPDRPGIQSVQIEACDGLSSTLVRQSLAAGRSIEGFVCGAVGQYIAERQLYSQPTA